MPKIFVALSLGLVVTAGISPAFAQSRPAYNGGYSITGARANALRECSAREATLVEYLWGVTEIQVYRACMNDARRVE